MGGAFPASHAGNWLSAWGSTQLETGFFIQQHTRSLSVSPLLVAPLHFAQRNKCLEQQLLPRIQLVFTHCQASQLVALERVIARVRVCVCVSVCARASARKVSFR